MRKVKKLGADALQESAMGHNRLDKEIEAKFLKTDADIVESIAQLNEKRKENLADAKDAGMLKTAIRKCTAESRKSIEARQEDAEVDDEKKRYIAICKEVGLFIPEEEAA